MKFLKRKMQFLLISNLFLIFVATSVSAQVNTILCPHISETFSDANIYDLKWLKQPARYDLHILRSTETTEKKYSIVDSELPIFTEIIFRGNSEKTAGAYVNGSSSFMVIGYQRTPLFFVKKLSVSNTCLPGTVCPGINVLSNKGSLCYSYNTALTALTEIDLLNLKDRYLHTVVTREKSGNSIQSILVADEPVTVEVEYQSFVASPGQSTAVYLIYTDTEGKSKKILFNKGTTYIKSKNISVSNESGPLSALVRYRFVK